jgi:hypothetical protein
VGPLEETKELGSLHDPPVRSEALEGDRAHEGGREPKRLTPRDDVEGRLERLRRDLVEDPSGLSIWG